MIVGVGVCGTDGIKCSRYLGAFDCLIVHFWFHELELTVEFIVRGDGLLDSLIIEGPIFRGPGNYAQVRLEVYTKYSSVYGDVIRKRGLGEVHVRLICGGVRREFFVGYGNEDFVRNPCRYAEELRAIANRPSDDLTLRMITYIMSKLGVALSPDQITNLLTC